MTPERLVYVVSRWGEPSQTFVRREAAAVAKLGVEVSAATLKPVGAEPGGVEALWLKPWAVVAGAARSTLRRPVAVVRVLGAVVRFGAVRNLPANLSAALIGLAWVGSRRLAPGHLHTHFGWVAATAAWAAARLDGRTYSVMLHAFEIHDPRYRDGFTRIPLQEADQVFVISERDQGIVAERWGVSTVVVRIGVPASWLADEVGVCRDADLVVSIGRLVEKKGFSTLIAALELTAHPWRCHIVGDGPLREKLGEQVERLGLADRVTFLGRMDEAAVRRVLQGAAVMGLACVETSSGDRDGTPTVIVEAMASGAAVLTTDVGAIPEMVADAGLLVAPGDPRAIADALDRLSEERVREDLVRRGRARVADGWTNEATAQVLLEALSP